MPNSEGTGLTKAASSLPWSTPPLASSESSSPSRHTAPQIRVSSPRSATRSRGHAQRCSLPTNIPPQPTVREGRSVDPDLVTTIYADYSITKMRRGVIDLDDLIEKCADLLENDEGFASAQRWWYRHFFVDELQDLNPAQWRLLSAWLGDREDLFVVGDPLQAVYGWNGADKNLLGEIEELLPGMTVLRLDDNHRCSPNLVEVARAVLGAQEGLFADPQHA